jgi:hypothetical protein
MALKFTCKHCGKEIVVRHLKIGEPALCRTCGRETGVPQNAVETTETADYLNSIPSVPVPIAFEEPAVRLPFTGKKAWSPRGIHLLGLFFSPLPAGVTWALNFERFGLPERKLSSVLIAVGLFVAGLALTQVPGYIPMITPLFNGACATLYYLTQKNLFQKFIEEGGEKASFKLPIVNSILLTVILVGVTISVVFHKIQVASKEIQGVMDIWKSGDIDAAAPKVRELERNYPDAPFPCFAMGWLYALDGKFDSALMRVEKSRSLLLPDSAVQPLNCYVQEHIYEQRNQYDSALVEVEKYSRLHPDDTWVHESRIRLQSLISEQQHPSFKSQ